MQKMHAETGCVSEPLIKLPLVVVNMCLLRIVYVAGNCGNQAFP